MYPFKGKTPIRRPNRKECKEYSSYKKTLKADFNDRCGYCDDYDLLRVRNFSIDHFVPQTPDGFVHPIPSNNYYNLVYSCNYCNTAKSNTWPTKDHTTHNDGNKGFIDPIDKDYTNLFNRNNDGTIQCSDPKSNLAQYIRKELKLWLPIHEKMWKLEKIRFLNNRIQIKLEGLQDSEEKTSLEKEHYDILKLWISIQESIFVINA